MIVLDVETTGTNPEKNSLVSVGAVDFAHPEIQFMEECCIWDGAHVNEQALAINGFTEEEIREPQKKSEGEVVTLLLDWLKDRENIIIAGQNVFFDFDFLRAAANRFSLDFSLSKRIVDLHSIVYFHMITKGTPPPLRLRKTNLDSDTIMHYVGIPPEPKPHIALNGAIWEAEAFSRLMHEKSLFKQFEDFAIPWNTHGKN